MKKVHRFHSRQKYGHKNMEALDAPGWLTAVIPPSKIFEFETYHVMDNGCNVDAQTYKNKHQFNLIYKDHKYLSSG